MVARTHRSSEKRRSSRKLVLVDGTMNKPRRIPVSAGLSRCSGVVIDDAALLASHSEATVEQVAGQSSREAARTRAGSNALGVD